MRGHCTKCVYIVATNATNKFSHADVARGERRDAVATWPAFNVWKLVIYNVRRRHDKQENSQIGGEPLIVGAAELETRTEEWCFPVALDERGPKTGSSRLGCSEIQNSAVGRPDL